MNDSTLQPGSPSPRERGDAAVSTAYTSSSSVGGRGGRLDEDRSRPTGFVRPTGERAVRALAALDDDRLADAETHITALPDSPAGECAWKLQLGGLLEVARSDLAAAVPLFLQAASAALIHAYGHTEDCDTDAMRLAAWAVEKVGEVYRRQDCPCSAEEAHMTAFRLRSEHGSSAEMWETAVSLGLDAALAGRWVDAARWHRIAIDLGSRAAEEPAHKKAVAWTHLVNTLISDGHFEDSVAAARTARDLWREHDVGAVMAARADVNLGHALLRFGESLHDVDTSRCRSVLGEALQWLTGAREALLAFGPVYAADADWCHQQVDFAQRMIDVMD